MSGEKSTLKSGYNWGKIFLTFSKRNTTKRGDKSCYYKVFESFLDFEKILCRGDFTWKIGAKAKKGLPFHPNEGEMET